MALQEELREQNRRLNEYKEVYNKQQRELLLQEQRDPQTQGNGQVYRHYGDNMDHWHTHHGHQTTQDQNDFKQGYENVYHDIPAVGVACADPDLPQVPYTTSKDPAPSPRPSQSYQEPRTLPRTAVRDMMRNLDSGNQKFGPGLCTGGGQTPSEKVVIAP